MRSSLFIAALLAVFAVLAFTAPTFAADDASFEEVGDDFFAGERAEFPTETEDVSFKGLSSGARGKPQKTGSGTKTLNGCVSRSGPASCLRSGCCAWGRTGCYSICQIPISSVMIRNF
jgi:hypothetical protein